MTDSFAKLLACDVRRFGNGGWRTGLSKYFVPRGGCFRFVFWFRVVQAARRHPFLKYTIGIVAYVILRHYEFKYGIHANPNIRVGGGLRIAHGDGVHLNCREIGDNFTVYQNVTLGRGSDGGLPSVGDNVTIYPNAVVVGGIHIGEGATIGALSYVSKDVPPGVTVVGAPAVALGKNEAKHDKGVC